MRKMSLFAMVCVFCFCGCFSSSDDSKQSDSEITQEETKQFTQKELYQDLRRIAFNANTENLNINDISSSGLYGIIIERNNVTFIETDIVFANGERAILYLPPDGWGIIVGSLGFGEHGKDAGVFKKWADIIEKYWNYFSEEDKKRIVLLWSKNEYKAKQFALLTFIALENENSAGVKKAKDFIALSERYLLELQSAPTTDEVVPIKVNADISESNGDISGGDTHIYFLTTKGIIAAKLPYTTDWSEWDNMFKYRPEMSIIDVENDKDYDSMALFK
ncbi:MAG: hypothetical protein FWD54_02530 [Endomicrobia bacterium]|nr:hypothetical protein [Endomicrobiia bacterium]